MKVPITKIAAAQNQLRECIRLWFDDGDLSSMVVLVCSAHQIVSDINAARGGRDLIYDTLNIKDEYLKEWRRIIKAPYNFLKHAEHDPNLDSVVELDYETVEFFAVFTCMGLELLGYSHDLYESAFISYYMVLHPDFIREDAPILTHFPKSKLELVRNVPKKSFLEGYKLQYNANRG
jgi:hypothetical protein